MRIGIFGNCQAEGLALAVEAWLPGVETFRQPVATLPLGQPERLFEIGQKLLSCDYVLLQTVDQRRPQFRDFVTGIAETAPDRVARFPVVVFNGFHPDCVYVMRDGVAVDGPIGAYHSAIAAGAWLEGLSADRAAKLFNAYVYAQLGYFEAFDRGLTHLKSDAFDGYDLEVCASRGDIFMHTINHPVVGVLVEIARQALDRLGIGRRSSVAEPHDPLASSGIWPMYPELAHRLQLPANIAPLDFRSLVARNFRALQDAVAVGSKSDLTSGGPIGASAIDRARAFIRSEVI